MEFRCFPHIFAIVRNFPHFPTFLPQLLFARPNGGRVGALCVPCAEVLLREAAGGLVTAPQFPRNSLQVFLHFPQFPHNFPAVFRNVLELDLTTRVQKEIMKMYNFFECHLSHSRDSEKKLDDFFLSVSSWGCTHALHILLHPPPRKSPANNGQASNMSHIGFVNYYVMAARHRLQVWWFAAPQVPFPIFKAFWHFWRAKMRHHGVKLG